MQLWKKMFVVLYNKIFYFIKLQMKKNKVFILDNTIS